ncbi:MAG: ABC transporter ATP-binding protein [Oscillospiraceae bacterium]|nr:ABC transporter ATP-binding protein [Oscillospiraceae bacterium]
MKETKKPKYNMWQNTGFMIRTAWQTRRSVLWMCLLIAVVSAGLTAAQMLISPAILNKVESAAPLGELVGTIALFSGVLLVLSGLKTYLDENSVWGRVAVRLVILRKLAGKIAGTAYPNTLDTEFIRAENQSLDACSRNSASTEQIWTTWADILTNVLGFLVYLGLLSGLNPVLACLVAATTAVGFFVNKYINEWGYRHREEERAYLTKMGYVKGVDTRRSAAKDIRIFGLRQWLDDVWFGALGLYRAFVERREKVYLWTSVVDLLLTLLRNGIAYVYLIHLTLTEGMSASEFLLYFSTVSGFTAWITGILEKFTQLHKESLELSMIREFLDWPEPFRFDEGEPLPKDMTIGYEIRLENVSFRYPKAEKDTLTNIDLTIRPGEKLAIVGLNGAGKTTLVKLVCGFLDPTEGRVLLNGQDIRTYNRRDYYALFSAVFQDFSMLEASVAENVAQTLDDIDEGKVWDCLDKAGLTEKVHSLPHGLETKLGREVYEDGVELSGGQTQRLMLARALYKDGPILTLDEPTAALDPIAENDIYQKYSEMTKGKTSLFISHRLASTRFCDRILFLEGGIIAEEGTHESLMARGGGYAKLFDVQSQYYKEGAAHHGE